MLLKRSHLIEGLSTTVHSQFELETTIFEQIIEEAGPDPFP